MEHQHPDLGPDSPRLASDLMYCDAHDRKCSTSIVSRSGNKVK